MKSSKIRFAEEEEANLNGKWTLFLKSKNNNHKTLFNQHKSQNKD